MIRRPLAGCPRGAARSPRRAVLRKKLYREASGELEPEAYAPKLRGRPEWECLGRILADISLGRREVEIVNVPNAGAVPNLPPEAILEIEAVSDSTGYRGLYMGQAPVAIKGILEKRIAQQELLADAAVKGDKHLLLQALLLDELTISIDQAEQMLNELLAASKEALPQILG